MSCLPLGLSLLLLTVVCSSQHYEDFSPTPDYDSDYNATFDYSFYSNSSSDDLDRFSERFIDPEEEEGEELVAVTMTTIRDVTKGSGTDFRNAASLPVHQEVWMLIWTLIILTLLNAPRLQHTV